MKILYKENIWEIILFAVVVPLLLIFDFVPKDRNIIVLFSVFILVITITWLRVNKNFWKWKDLGIFRQHLNKKDAFKFYISLGFVCLLGYLIIKIYIPPYNRLPTPHPAFGLVAFSFVYSFVQEFLYRTYLLKVSDKVFMNKNVSNILNVFLFTGMHTFYNLSMFEYVLIALSGVIFVYAYRKYNNLLYLGLLHFLTNFLAISLVIFKPYLYL